MFMRLPASIPVEPQLRFIKQFSWVYFLFFTVYLEFSQTAW